MTALSFLPLAMKKILLKKPSLLVLTNELNCSNGWATVGYELCNFLRRRYNLTILTLKQARNDTLSGHIVPVLSYQTHPLLSLVHILKRISWRKVDLILCNVEEFFLTAFLLKLLLRSKLVMIGHGSFIYNSFAGSPKRAKLLHLIDRLIVPSRYTCQKVQEFYRNPVEVIPWGVNLTRYAPVRDVKKQPAFIFVGELKDRKGVKPLIQAFQRVLRDVPVATLYMVGEVGKYRDVYFSEEERRQVVFSGRVSHQDLLTYYSRSIVHVLPSVNARNDFEGFGLVHLEANACGLPTIGSLNCGNEEAIVNGVTGFLCPQNDVKCVSQRMKTLLTDDELRNKMSRQALEFAQQQSWEQVGERMLAVFKTL